MLARANTFHSETSVGCGSSRYRRFNISPAEPGKSSAEQLEPIRLPPIKKSSASPQEAAGSRNNELARLRAQRTVGCDARLCFSEATMFPLRKSNKTAISTHPKFIDQHPSGRYYYPGYSPYLMDSDSEQRYFMSGYSGFVPRLRYLNGATFPVLTHDAMDEFDCGRRSHAAALATTAGDSAEKQPPACGAPGRGRHRGRRGEGVIYRKLEGLVTNYQGHVPGHLRRFGGSFGRITVNARELP